MDETIPKLRGIIGDECLSQITTHHPTSDESDLANSKEIFCDCKTLILRPNHAKLILPTKSMLEVERELKFFQQGDKLFKNIIRGCYWLIDDMYKFEQMGYTREINAQNLKRPPNNNANTSDDQNSTEQNNDKSTQSTTNALNGLRYLVCAECNLCPLGWFDPKTKESYLHVWPGN